MLHPAEQAWWWKVAMHLDEAQLTMIKVLVNSSDDPTPVHLLQSKLRDAQAFLLEIFRWKGLLPGLPVAAAVEGPVAAGPSAMEAVVVPDAPVAPVVTLSSQDSEHLTALNARIAHNAQDIIREQQLAGPKADPFVEDPAVSVQEGVDTGAGEVASTGDGEGARSVDEVDPVHGLPSVELSKSASNLRAVDELDHREGLDR